LRLLDCLGLTIPFCFLTVVTGLVVVVTFRFGGGGGSGAGFNTGDERNAEGDGIVIVSILTVSYTDTSTALEPVMLNTLSRRRSWGCVVEVQLTLLSCGEIPHGQVKFVSSEV